MQVRKADEANWDQVEDSCGDTAGVAPSQAERPRRAARPCGEQLCPGGETVCSHRVPAMHHDHMFPLDAGPSRGGFGILARLRSDTDPTQPAVQEAPPQVKPPPPKPVATAPPRPQAMKSDMPSLLEPPGGFRSYIRSEAAAPAKPARVEPLPKLAAKPARPQPPPAPQLPPQPAAREARPLPTLAARPARPQPPPAPEAPAQPAAAPAAPEPMLVAKPEQLEPTPVSEAPAPPGASGEPQAVPAQAQPKAAELAEPQVPAAPEPPVLTNAFPMQESLPVLAAKPARRPSAPEGKQPRPAEGPVPALQPGAPGAEQAAPATQPQPQLPRSPAGRPVSLPGLQDVDSQMELAAAYKRAQQAEQQSPVVPGVGPDMDRQVEQAAVASRLQSGQQVPVSEAAQGEPEAEVPAEAPKPLRLPQPAEQPPALLPKPVRPPPEPEPVPVSQAPAGLQRDGAGAAPQGYSGSAGAAAASRQQAPAEVPQPGPADAPALQLAAQGLRGASAELEQQPAAGSAERLAQDADDTGSGAGAAAAEEQQSPALLPKPVRPVASPQAPASSATQGLDSTHGAGQAGASGWAGDAVVPKRPPAGSWLPPRDRPPQLLAKPARPPSSGAASSSRLTPQLGFEGPLRRAQRKQEQAMLLLDTVDAELAAKRQARLAAVEEAARGIAGRVLPPAKGSDLGGVLSSTRAAEAGTQNEASLIRQAAEAGADPRRWPQPGPRQQAEQSQPQIDGLAAAQPGEPAQAELEARLKAMLPQGEHQDGFAGRQTASCLPWCVQALEVGARCVMSSQIWPFGTAAGDRLRQQAACWTSDTTGTHACGSYSGAGGLLQLAGACASRDMIPMPVARQTEAVYGWQRS